MSAPAKPMGLRLSKKYEELSDAVGPQVLSEDSYSSSEVDALIIAASDDYSDATARAERAEGENKRLREALEFYADPLTYGRDFVPEEGSPLDDDCSVPIRNVLGQVVPGQRARATLKEPSDGE